MMSTAIGRLRLTGIIEGISYILLLGVAMPLKYLAGMPLAVRVVGMVHGVLFIAFCFFLYRAMEKHEWPISEAAIFFIASLVPFGPLFIDKRLRAHDTSES